MKANLTKRPKLLRSDVARGLAAGDNTGSSPVDPTGGDNGAGIIRGMAIITRGEARGHFGWIDKTFLSQVAAAIAAKPKGTKARFTHPSASGDGLGKNTGRVKNASIDGDVVRGDLHFAQHAHETPDGDLARYLMKLATDDPDAFGNSIAFDFDREAELELLLANGAEWVEADWGRELSLENFKSPDPKNTQNLPHFRLKTLHAVDAVDDPAANPSGLFRRPDDIAAEADKLIAYSMGLSNERPDLVALDVDPDRLTGFLQRFLARHQLAITSLTKGHNVNIFEERGKQLRAERAKQLAAENKNDRDEDIDAVEQEEADADKDEGNDEGTDQRQNLEDDADDKDKGKETEEKKELAKGGEKPNGDTSNDEGTRQDEYQEDQKEIAERSKKDAEEETPVGSPSSKKGKGVGPLGDASNNVGAASAAKPAAQLTAAEGKRFLDAFGDQGGVWFAQGKTFAQAQALHQQGLKADNERLKSENAELQKKLTGRRGESKPLAAATAAPSDTDKKVTKLQQNLGSTGMARFAAGLQIPRHSNN
jgi:hypothetical protein